MAASRATPDTRRPAHNLHGLITKLLMRRHKKAPALAEGQDGL